MIAPAKTRDLSPQWVKAALDAQEILLVDVREPEEFVAEHIAGAVNYPLSRLDPDDLPSPADRMMVLQCGSGKRSATAVDLCRKAGHTLDAHLAGGIGAWKAAGLATVATGGEAQAAAVRDRS